MFFFLYCFFIFLTFPSVFFSLLHAGCLFEKRLCTREQFCSEGEYHTSGTIDTVILWSSKTRTWCYLLCPVSISCSWWSNREIRIIAWQHRSATSCYDTTRDTYTAK